MQEQHRAVVELDGEPAAARRQLDLELLDHRGEPGPLGNIVGTPHISNAAAVTGPTQAAITSAWKAVTTSSRRPVGPAASISAATAGAEVKVTASSGRSAIRSIIRNIGSGSSAPATR